MLWQQHHQWRYITVDNTAPTITSATLNAANTLLTVVFSEDVYSYTTCLQSLNASGDLDVSDFTLSMSQEHMALHHYLLQHQLLLVKQVKQHMA